MDVYGLVAACFALVAVAIALILSATVLKGKNAANGTLYGFLDLNGSKFEVSLKAFYIAFTVYYVLMLPTAFGEGISFLIGFKSLVRMIIVNIVGTRLVFEGLMLVYRTYVQVCALNKHFGVQAPEMLPVYQQPAPAAMVAPAAPVAATPMAMPVVPAPVAPVPMAQPVVPAPVAAPVAPAPAEPSDDTATMFAAPAVKVCLGCGKPLKDGVKFCPYCGTNQ